MSRLTIGLLFLLLALGPGRSLAAERAALVIGNASYARPLQPLPLSVADGRDMAAALGKLGYEVVQAADVDLAGMRGALDRFRKAVQSAQVALVYFSGHGVQVDNENFLVPIGARVGAVEDVPRAALPLAEILRLLDDVPRRLNLVILDACSDSGLETRDGRRVTGLARVAAPPQTLVAYAADLNQLASGGFNRNSIYTQELLKQIATPGLRLEDIFGRTRAGVLQISQNKQRPIEISALTSEGLDLSGKAVKSGVVIVERGPGAKDPPRRPREEFRDCPECPPLVAIPVDGPVLAALGGTGAGVLRPYAIGKHEVTIGEWNRCAAETAACQPRPGADNQPVARVNWSDANAYANWLSARTGRSYRLPLEAEWEHAARGGVATRYAWGDDPSAGKAACRGCGSPYDGKAPAPAGSFPPNAYGLYEMHGNVWEWVEDCPTTNDAAASCGKSLLRGGSYRDLATSATSSFRGVGPSPSQRREDFGFRVARSLNY